MDSKRRCWVNLALVAAMTALLVPSQAVAAPTNRSQIFTFSETPEPVTGAFTLLQRGSDGARAEARTFVEAGHAFTLWWIAFNNPTACSAPGCGEDDIFTFDSNGNITGLNVPQIQAADISVFGTGGAVSNPGGRLRISSEIMEGAAFEAGQLVIGRDADGAIFGVSDVTGLVDAQAAEIHLVVQDHGVAHEEPSLLEQQITQFHGACNPNCSDIQFSVHLPGS